MDDLVSLRVFLEVARRKSFSGTATHFGMSRASVTKHVAKLEDALQVRLLNRTTKQMSLTLAGMHVVASGGTLLTGVEELKSTLKGLSNDLAGIIRLGVAPSFGSQRLLPVLHAFAERYVDIQITLTLLTQRKEETFIAGGLDVGIIIASSLKDATHSGIHLATAPQALVASPKYLAKRGAIERLEDLLKCNCLINVNKSPTDMWKFTGPEGPASIRVQGPLRSDFGEALKAAAISGMGVSIHPYYMIDRELEAGLLEVVLPQYTPEQLNVFAIYSAQKTMPLRVRTFIDFIKGWAHAHPDWQQARGPTRA